MMTNFEVKGERKVTREGRVRAGLVQGRDETHRMNGKSKGKGNGGKGDKGGNGGKGEHGGKGETREATEEKEDMEERERQGRKRIFSRVKKSRRQTRRTSRSRWRLTWRPVAHTHRPCWMKKREEHES